MSHDEGSRPGSASHDEGGRPGSASHEGGEGGGKGLGPFLCWAVVFADIGTSVYYTPGILFGQPSVRAHAALFVGLTLLVFVLLTRKYGEVAVRYPEGGGVVTVAAHALHPFAGLVGGLFILVDYFLTAAISALSGIIYLGDVLPALKPVPVQLGVALAALVALALLNLVGVNASATVNATFATIAAASQLLVVAAVVVHVGPARLLADLPRVLAGPRLTPLTLLTGYAGAFLAFSGLESISQLSPAMAEPRRRVTRLALGAVVASIGLTSPLLTLWATTVLPVTSHTDPNQFISLLGGYAAGRGLEIEVAVSGALLLVFASNTALIGGYHVFLALARLGFLPTALEHRNRLRGTPHWAILTAVTIPLLVLLASRGNVGVLGDLYAFGLLGAFSLTCLCLDIVRWHERHPERPRRTPTKTSVGQGQDQRQRQGHGPEGGAGVGGSGGGEVGPVVFALGALTTALVTLAWATNLFAKPLATLFGGGVTVVGLVIGLVTYAWGRRHGRPLVFPVLFRPGYPVAFLSRGRRLRPTASVLAVLPRDAARIGALVAAADKAARGEPVIFVQRGRDDIPTRSPRLLEIVNPYLDDPAAREALARAERLARQRGLRHRFLYLPSTAGPHALADYWRALRPTDTVVVAGDEDVLSACPVERTEQTVEGTTPILHYRAAR